MKFKRKEGEKEAAHEYVRVAAFLLFCRFQIFFPGGVWAFALLALVIPTIKIPISATVSTSNTATTLFINPYTNNIENTSTDSATKHK